MYGYAPGDVSDASLAHLAQATKDYLNTFHYVVDLNNGFGPDYGYSMNAGSNVGLFDAYTMMKASGIDTALAQQQIRDAIAVYKHT